jgi:histidinol dehydrogenase
MNIIKYPEKNRWTELLSRPVMKHADIDSLVMPVIEDVRLRGDKALYEYTSRFDKAELEALEISAEEFTEADTLVTSSLKNALSVAISNIERFHDAQRLQKQVITTMDGVDCWQKAVAIQKVGLYIPGGSAPLFSTVLMLAIPARIAGCSEIVLCTPPSHTGKVHPAILYAAKITGVTRVFKVGGAQAIAAMAYGTETIPAVHKIFGPGNQYVTAAKQIVSRNNVAIDMPAGPSELAVIADESANPAYVAADLLSQAEHGTDSQVLLFTISENMANQVLAEIEKQVEKLPRKEIARGALKNSRVIVLRQMSEVLDIVNEYAPEHLILATKDAIALAEQVINAGSVFIGHFATESAGDYASGTNHTLPTNGYARMYSGVNLDSFMKKITFQNISRQGLENIGPSIMTMAENEELMAHRNAVYLRLQHK